MATLSGFDGGTHRTAKGLSVFDGTQWRSARTQYVFDGATWRLGFVADLSLMSGTQVATDGNIDTSGDWTVEFWMQVNFHEQPAFDPVFVWVGDNLQFGYSYLTGAYFVEYYSGDTNDYQRIDLWEMPLQGGWQHFALAYGTYIPDGILTLYCNGVWAGEAVLLSPQPSLSYLRLEATYGNYSAHRFDEVRWWAGTDRTPTQIASNYGRELVAGLHTLPTHYWQMKEKTEAAGYDYVASHPNTTALSLRASQYQGGIQLSADVPNITRP
jgi:hypothetical protein